MKKAIAHLLLIIFIFGGKLVAQDADKLILKVGTFPEDYVGRNLQFDKVYGWFRLEPKSTSNSSETYYKVTICSTQTDDCSSSKLGIFCSKIVPVVNKNLSKQLIENDLSTDNLKYICRLTGKVVKKKVSLFEYILLISKVEIYNSDLSKIIEVYQQK